MQADLRARHIVVARDRKGVAEEAGAVVPPRDLHPRCGQARHRGRAGQDRDHGRRRAPRHRDIGAGPHYHHEHADERQVREAVRERVVTHLHQAARGREHPDEPQPADEEVRPLAA